MTYEVEDFFGKLQPQQSKMPARATGGTRKMTFAHELSRQVPLAGPDDWLTFAEGLIGRRHMDEDTERFFGRNFTSLSEISEFERKLDAFIGVDASWTLAERFPWLLAAEQIAGQQGFFHWELSFAQIFERGGFDLQVGNPPWVRPRWNEPGVLAERDPWFELIEQIPADVWRDRRAASLRSSSSRSYLLAELTAVSAVSGYLSESATYPLLVGTQPDLYRAFMCRVWAQLSPHGTAGMIHPDSHFGGVKEANLRRRAYEHLRVHGGFVNVGNWAFADANRKLEFGIHVYASASRVGFLHLSQMFSARSFVESLSHDGSGPAPGLKYRRKWDIRPHRERIVHVDEGTLAVWQKLRGESGDPGSAALLQPVSQQEERAILALASFGHRLSADNPRISRGYDEANAKKEGMILWRQENVDWGQLVLQGPYIGVGTPLAKMPRVPCRNNSDWDAVDLKNLHDQPRLRTNYVILPAEQSVKAGQDRWGGRYFTDFYRLAWREMIPVSTERSLFAAIIPPGPNHVHAVRSMALASARRTSLAAGFWASLPLDYILRITGRGHLDVADAGVMPNPQEDHPLGSALLHRTLRLNSLTSAYSSLWDELFDPAWAREGWAVKWQGLPPLSDVGPSWNTSTPLRTERSRRAALVELDALVAVWVGMGIDELLAILRSRYGILTDREDDMWFDSAGRRIAADSYAFGVKQSKEDYSQFLCHLDEPLRNPVPHGYKEPFYKANRADEYRQAHAVFSRRVQDAIDAGWTPS